MPVGESAELVQHHWLPVGSKVCSMLAYPYAQVYHRLEENRSYPDYLEEISKAVLIPSSLAASDHLYLRYTVSRMTLSLPFTDIAVQNLCGLMRTWFDMLPTSHGSCYGTPTQDMLQTHRLGGTNDNEDKQMVMCYDSSASDSVVATVPTNDLHIMQCAGNASTADPLLPIQEGLSSCHPASDE